MKRKKFWELGTRDVIRILLHDHKIKADVARYSLARVVPILKHEWLGDLEVLKQLHEEPHDPHYLEWKQHCEETEKLIKAGEAKLHGHSSTG